MSIRSVMAATIAALLAIEAGAIACLFVLTTQLHRDDLVWTSAARGIQIAEEIELNLLRHNRLDGPATTAVSADLREDRKLLATAVTEQLATARGEAEGSREREIVTRAERDVTAYLGAPDDTRLRERRLTTALATLSELVAFNVAEAENASLQAARLNALTNATGVLAGLLLLAGTVAALAWLRSRAFGPLFDLTRVIDRFTGGDATARAPEHGPAEIREISQAFNRMAEELDSQADRQLTFLAGVAHDLRTPLEPLKLAADMGRRPGVLADLPQAQRMFDVVTRQVEQLERMTGDLLDAARIQGGRLEIRPEACDLRVVAGAVAELFSGPQASHRLDLLMPDIAVRTCCDPVRIHQVLVNLVSNAVKYSTPGSVITIAVRDQGDTASIAVTDEGIGIEREELAHIFEPFRRSAAVQTAISGAGLGLAVSRRIVQAHAGRLDVVSLPGVGSTFTVTLPAVQSLLPASVPRLAGSGINRSRD